MTPRIVQASEKKLIGKRLKMSLAHNKTGELWKSFVPRRSEIRKPLTKDWISLQVYEAGHFAEMNPTREFEKWAAVEVSDFDEVPDDMETFTLKGGLYAIFDYKGSSNDSRIFQFIFGVWLPGSEYELDERPHLEVLGEKYKNNDPESEEEIWIPVKPR
ncbi:MAG: AraC family transcriptional regulator [Bacteroidetes bacterium]|nr:MAG: AraC family transcriptional regulator [Bacteroidota bacterium]